jgi:hypothetical protein
VNRKGRKVTNPVAITQYKEREIYIGTGAHFFKKKDFLKGLNMLS